MRLIIMFDLPMLTSEDKRIYRKFSKYLSSNGYIRIQFSVYSKLCINSDSANTAVKKLKKESPVDGDIRYMVVTERQYKNIISINDVYSLQEEITNSNRIMIIGGMNNENSK